MCLSTNGRRIRNVLNTTEGEAVQDSSERPHANGLADCENARQSTRLSEMRFRQFFETLPESCYMVSPAGLILDVNPAACRAFGYAKEELVGKHVSMIYAPESRRRLPEIVARWKQTGNICNEEMVVLTKQGEKRIVLVNAGSVFDEKGTLLHSTSVQVDITDRRKAEEARFRHAAILESSDDAVISTDLAGAITSWNAGAQRMFGYTEDEVVGKSVAVVIPSDLRNEGEDILIQLRAGKRIEHLETQRVTRDGKRIDVSTNISPLRNREGMVIGSSSMLRDITERKRAAAALQDSEERLREALQLGKMYAIDWDVASDVVIRSDEAMRIHGLAPESTYSSHRGMLDKVHPEDKARFISSITELTPERPNCQTRFRVLRPDGSALWLERTGHAYFDAQGKMVRMLGIVADVTEQKLAERELAVAYDRLRMAMDSGKSVGWDRDLKTGRDVLFGDLQSIFGIPVQTYVGAFEDFRRRVHPEDLRRVLQAIDEAMEARKPYAAEFRVVSSKGAVRWLSAKGKFYYSSSGEPERFVGISVDITERKVAEQALSSVSQKLIEAQEQERSVVAGELHDDINQRLALLAVNLDIMKQSIPGSAVQLGRQVERASALVADITKDIQAVSQRLHSSQLKILGLAAAANGLCQEFAQRHSVAIEYRSQDVPKELSPQASLTLFRILQEALQNATKHSGSQHFQVFLTGKCNNIELTVHDSGSGFELEEAIKGRGLGLTSMKERIKLVDGELSIESQFQRGTTLRARVPLNQDGKSMKASN